ncbi:type II toxin-antitoxin system VapC family toxin [Blastococcus sp. BMG 814]|uniref:Ribonuclease VapC n=1 Tax=Blastococcus carthaginiensis TaxID=3050034 RepID=A0ABT9ICH4_9ACTN|nr:type II toxin-antitoxin system VapC family toxin [Blastococcus carthaginiensis]MDP5183269.1 type II toxin-antitoxin system VapC family toxin [Blastococcus carthaginiensis]
MPDLLDTSAAVAFLVQDHEHHEATFTALADRELGLAGHAAFETFSVLTRLPSASRLVPGAAHRLLATNFTHSRFLSSERTAALLAIVADHRIAGGSVYDALVGATAAEHGLTLISRDRRALDTYRALNVSVEMID